MPSLPTFLHALRIIEFANVLAGPAVGMFFAGLGSTVIKLENPRTGGDVTRSWRLPSENPNNDISAYFSAVNWGKQSVLCDLESGPGRELAERLCSNADIVLLNFKPGTSERFGLDYAALRKKNPRLIHASVFGYAPNNPRVGYDAVIQAESGFMFLNGAADGPPTKMPVALIDLLAAHEMKQAILLALLNREISGEGSEITVSLFDTAVLSLANQATNWLVAGENPLRQGSTHPNIAPYGELFLSRDAERIVLAIGSDRQFNELLSILSLQDLGSLEKYKDNSRRVLHREELTRELSEKFALFDAADLLRRFREHDIPAGLVNSVQEVFAQPDVRQRLVIEAIQHETTKLLGIRPFGFSISSLAQPPKMNRPPHLGEHSA